MTDTFHAPPGRFSPLVVGAVGARSLGVALAAAALGGIVGFLGFFPGSTPLYASVVSLAPSAVPRRAAAAPVKP